MMRSLALASAAAFCFGLAVPAAADPPPPGTPAYQANLANQLTTALLSDPVSSKVMSQYRAELQAGQMTQQQYDHLNQVYQDAVVEAANAVASDPSIAAMTDPNATMAVEQGLQGITDASHSNNVQAVVSQGLNAAAVVAQNYFEPANSLAQTMVDQGFNVEIKVAEAAQNMDGASPSVQAAAAQQLAQATQKQTTANDYFSQQQSQISSGITAIQNMTPDQLAQINEKVKQGLASGQLKMENGVPVPNPDYQPPSQQPPPPWATQDTSGSNTSTTTTSPSTSQTASNSQPTPRDPNLPPGGNNQNPANDTANLHPNLQPPPANRNNQPPPPQTTQQDQPPQQQPPQLPPPPPVPRLTDKQETITVDNQQVTVTIKSYMDENGNMVPYEQVNPDGTITYLDKNGNPVPIPDDGIHTVTDKGNTHGGTLHIVGGDDYQGSDPALDAAIAAAVQAGTIDAETLKALASSGKLGAQTTGPGSSAYNSYQVFEGNGMTTVATLIPIYNGWNMNANVGNVLTSLSSAMTGPSSVMNSLKLDFTGPSSVMTSLLNELPGLTLTSGLRVGTPLGHDWSLPYANNNVVGFTSLCGF
jgi:hypothetical protein